MEVNLIEKEIPNINKIRLKKIRMKIDLTMLNGILAVIYKDSVLRTRKALKNTQKLFNAIDTSIYEKDEQSKARIWLIQKSLQARLDEGFENDEMCIQYCKEDPESTELTDTIISNISNFKISYDEMKWIIRSIDDRLQYGYTITLKDTYQELLDRINDGDFKSYKAVEKDLYNIATSLVNIKRSVNSLDADSTFSLQDELFEETVTQSVEHLQDINKVFVTGIRRLNTILAPGYQSKRLYMYLAFPGGGKSQMLLKAALDIKKYNAHIKPKDPDKTPAVLMITMENDIDETVERIFNMRVSPEDIRNYTPKQVIKKLREEGEMTLTDKNNIDIIIKYYPNRSIETNDLYGIIRDLYDSGTEVVALILDYIKRIRPSEKANTEKEELKNISNELKSLAKKLDIPVITAQQLNRTAASVIDSAIQSNKEDVTRLVGRDAIAGAWELLENADCTIVINQEVKADTGEVFLTFKLLKRRYRSHETDEKLARLEYFNHPYEIGNTIKLVDDIDLPKSVSLFSLSTTFVSLEDTKRGKTTISGKNKDVKVDSKTGQVTYGKKQIFDAFDINKVVQ